MGNQRRVAIALRHYHFGPQHQRVLAGVLRFAREHRQWQCIIDESPADRQSSDGESNKHYDGIIARASDYIQHQIAPLGVPLVNTLYRQIRPDVAGVYPDAEVCGRAIGEHLVDCGFRRLVYLIEDDYIQSADIARAFAHTAEQAGCACRGHTIDTGTRPMQEFWTLMRDWLVPLLDQFTPPIGVLVSMPIAARALAVLCAERGWRVGQDVAIVCSENTPDVLEAPPRITSIDCNYEQIGYEAAALLERMMTDPTAPPQQLRIAPRGMILRESTDFYAVEDPVVAEALGYISAHLRENLSVIRLAEALGVSQRTLQRRFAAAMRRSVAMEVRRLRLVAAKRLLDDPTMQVAQVAEQVGFGSATAMNLIFHRETGMSPRQFRNNLKGR